MAYQRKTVSVCFMHDLEDGWYEVRFPDKTLDGSYASHVSIEKLASKHGWKIRWLGNDYYNPWKRK